MEVNNNQKLREALEAINSIDTRGLNRLLYVLVEADIFDGGQINKTISAVEKARRALAEPLRNCDLYATKDEAREAFQNLRGHRVLADVSLWDDRDEIEAMFDWLFAKTKGGE